MEANDPYPPLNDPKLEFTAASERWILSRVRQEMMFQRAQWNQGRDDAHQAHDWVAILTRQLGLAAPESPGLPVDPTHWERQLLRIMAVAWNALEAHFRNKPERLNAAWAPKEGSGF